MSQLIIEYYLTQKDVDQHERLAPYRRFRHKADYKESKRKGRRNQLIFVGFFITALLFIAAFYPQHRLFIAMGIPVILWMAYRGTASIKAFDEQMRKIEEQFTPSDRQIKLGIGYNYLYDYNHGEMFRIDTAFVEAIEEDETFFTISITDKFNYIIPKNKLSTSDSVKLLIRLKKLANFRELDYYSNKIVP